MEEDGRGGQFRVLTHLDADLAAAFKIEPSTAGILISDVAPQLPYLMQGHMKIMPGVPAGEHGLTIFVKGKKVFSRMGMIRIVRPTVGQMGSVQNLMVEDRYRRPGDTIQIYVQGTGLSVNDLPKLNAVVEEFEVGKASFTYISPLQLRLAFTSPQNMPIGKYSVKITGEGNTTLFEKKNLFEIVSANWVAGVQVAPPLRAGGSSQLKIVGRDFSDAFVSSFKVDLDEPGIRLSPLIRQGPTTLIADISAAASVSPGDYWLHLSAQGNKVTPPFGSIIKVEPAQ